MAAANLCPSCGAEVSEDAVLCVKCGYDFGTKRRIRSVLDAARHEPPVRAGRSRLILLVGLLCVSGVILAVALMLRKAGPHRPVEATPPPPSRESTEEAVLPEPAGETDAEPAGATGEEPVPGEPPSPYLADGAPLLRETVEKSQMWRKWFEAMAAGGDARKPLVYFRLEKAFSFREGRQHTRAPFRLTVVTLDSGRIVLSFPERDGITGTLSIPLGAQELTGVKLSEILDAAAAAAMAARVGQGDAFVPYLANIMKENEGLLQTAAALALARLGGNGLRALASFVQSEDKPLRLLAIDTLARMCQTAGEARPTLVGALKHKDADTRRASVLALGSIAPGEKDVGAAITGLIHDPDEEVRKAAVVSLGGWGAGGVGPLIAAFRDKSEAVASAAQAAVVQIGPAAVPELARALGKPDDPKTEHAAFALEKTGNKYSSTWNDVEDVTPLLINALLDEDMRMRPPLARFGARAVPAVSRVLRESENWEIRRAALVILEMMGDEAKGVVPTLIDTLRDKDAELRDRGIRILGKLGAHAAAAAPALVEALRDDEEVVRDAAARVLAGLGKEARPALPALIKGVQAGDLAILDGASRVLAHMGAEASPAVPALIESLAKVDERTATAVIKALGGIGPEAGQAAPELVRILENNRAGWGIRQAAASALGRTRGPGALEALEEALLDDSVEAVRFAAASALGTFGGEAVPPLTKALISPDRGVRKQAALALSALGKEAEPALPDLTNALLDQDAFVRAGVADALVGLGGTAVPALVNALERDDLRIPALLVLEKIGPAAKEAVPALARLLKQPYQLACIEAVRVLGSLGPEASPILVDLVAPPEEQAAIKHDIGLRRAAIKALARIAPPSTAAVSALGRALSDTDAITCRHAAEALAGFGAAAAAAVPQLMNALAGKNPQAGSALAAIGTPALPSLIKALDSPSEHVRRSALDILAAIGPDAGPALPALLKLLGDQDATVRGAALRAVKAVNPPAQ